MSATIQKFYQYYYTTINLGAITAGVVTPLFLNYRCGQADCMIVSVGICAVLLSSGGLVFWCGKKYYRSVRENDGRRSGVQQVFGGSVDEQSFGWTIVSQLLIISPSFIFYLASEQNWSTWQELSLKMDSTGFLGPIQTSIVLGPFWGFILVPVFVGCIYPLFARMFRSKEQGQPQPVTSPFLPMPAIQRQQSPTPIFSQKAIENPFRSVMLKHGILPQFKQPLRPHPFSLSQKLNAFTQQAAQRSQQHQQQQHFHVQYSPVSGHNPPSRSIVNTNTPRNTSPSRRVLLLRMTIGYLFAAVTYMLLMYLQNLVDRNCPESAVCEVKIYWMILVYMCITCAEILFCVSGLSFVHSTLPPKFKHLTPIVWYSQIAIGNLAVAGLLWFCQGLSKPEYFLLIAILCTAVGVVQVFLGFFLIEPTERIVDNMYDGGVYGGKFGKEKKTSGWMSAGGVHNTTTMSRKVTNSTIWSNEKCLPPVDKEEITTPLQPFTIPRQHTTIEVPTTFPGDESVCSTPQTPLASYNVPMFAPVKSHEDDGGEIDENESVESEEVVPLRVWVEESEDVGEGWSREKVRVEPW
ncbi:hypothetical protein HK098_005567 [Nowakowskiella sp. JEL0407]|nr:hypothetical protein HK098_005567 [Nowakowskiella sp. JEL0407]